MDNAVNRDMRLGSQDTGEGLRDWGSFCATPAYCDDDYKGHRSENAALYIGLHLPDTDSTKRHRRRRHHHHRGRESDTTDGKSPHAPPSTPPSQRVKFMLGQEDEDEEHKSHDIFCEMSQLTGDDGDDPEDWEWMETARWIKFEEDVEEGGERWSKPHVATLSLYSLFELRKSLLSGTVLLDMDAVSLVQIADLILDNMISTKQLKDDQRDNVREALLRRHRHLHEKKHRKSEAGTKSSIPLIRSLAEIGRKRSEPSTMNPNHSVGGMPRNLSTGKLGRVGSGSRLTAHNDSSPGMSQDESSADLHESESRIKDKLEKSPSFKRRFSFLKDDLGMSSPYLKRRFSSYVKEEPRIHSPSLMRRFSEYVKEAHFGELDVDRRPSFFSKLNVGFMKKIPPGAEASNILVGEVDFLQNPIIAFTRLSKAVLLGDLTEVPVPTRFLFILLGPKGNTQKYHEIGRSIATLMSDEVFHDVAYKAKNRQDLLSGVDEFLSNCTVLPPGEWDPSIRIEPPKSVPSQESRRTETTPVPNGTAQTTEPAEEHGDPTLIRTGRLFGGLIDDIRRKVPFYYSDIKDALHIQAVASFFFLYFACFTPIITFGGLLGDATDQNMAAMESILAGCICGVVYSLCAGQPLTILGSTGPVLVFETITYHFCFDNGLNYLSFRWWIGLWSCIFLLIIVMFDLSALVRFITRFTEESFAALISLIFIKEAFAKVFKILSSHPMNMHPEIPLNYDCFCMPGNDTNLTDTITTVPPNALPTTLAPNLLSTTLSPLSDNASIILSNMTKEDCVAAGGVLDGPGCDTPVYYDNVFFFSLLLFFGTFVIATGLKGLRNTHFFPTIVRTTISDFAVMLAIVSMVGLDAAVGLKTPKLDVPKEFRPTRSDRDWFIHPFGPNPWWTSLAAILPALLAVILIFMDQQITAVIVNRKENKLKKGSGYHLDLFIVALLIGLCSMMGLPWFVAATVLSITHVMSLKKESECSAPGERPQFLGVREQRMTGTLVFLMIGLSVLLTFILILIPMPVLYGVFLYMGVSSLKGVQLINRILIMFMPAKYQPDYMYLRNVAVKRVHIFTCVQVLCLAVLWTVKTIKTISIAFPLMVLAMCFVRKGLDYVFTQEELKWLDDIMPETHRRAKDEEEKKKKEKEEEGEDGDTSRALEFTKGGEVEIPLSDGHVMSIPVEKITYKPDTQTINISEEMAKTAVWRQLASNAEKEHIGTKKPKKRHHRHHRPSKKTTPPIIETIEEKRLSLEEDDAGIILNLSPKKTKEKGKDEEMQQLMPEIIVEPPSGSSSPTRDSPV
ncbi:sodium bicarbonate cotransporter 3-like isoform X2 [Lineus longissimus]|uniref:sodium bicarbonate cotransporter 3-like isoform X2 n=1 Tax=Lineus longissimus TaxID=88925 RepID=UPI00315D428F